MAVAAVAVTGLSSCDDFLTIYPTDKTIGEDFWKTKEDVDNMVTGAYSSMLSSEIQRRAIIWGAYRSDELVKTASSTAAISFLAMQRPLWKRTRSLHLVTTTQPVARCFHCAHSATSIW